MARRKTQIPDLITDPVVLERRAVARYLDHLESGTTAPAGELELDFVQVALRYSVRLGISREAWQVLGVPEPVLDEVGFI